MHSRLTDLPPKKPGSRTSSDGTVERLISVEQRIAGTDDQWPQMPTFYLLLLTYVPTRSITVVLKVALSVTYYWPFVDNVTCSGEETLRVCCTNVAGTCLCFQTSIVGVNDVNDIWSIAAETHRLVFACRSTKSYSIHVQVLGWFVLHYQIKPGVETRKEVSLSHWIRLHSHWLENEWGYPFAGYSKQEFTFIWLRTSCNPPLNLLHHL